MVKSNGHNHDRVDDDNTAVIRGNTAVTGTSLYILPRYDGKGDKHHGNTTVYRVVMGNDAKVIQRYRPK